MGLSAFGSPAKTKENVSNLLIDDRKKPFRQMKNRKNNIVFGFALRKLIPT
jgi:hypothetical protein